MSETGDSQETVNVSITKKFAIGFASFETLKDSVKQGPQESLEESIRQEKAEGTSESGTIYKQNVEASERNIKQEPQRSMKEETPQRSLLGSIKQQIHERMPTGSIRQEISQQNFRKSITQVISERNLAGSIEKEIPLGSLAGSVRQEIPQQSVRESIKQRESQAMLARSMKQGISTSGGLQGTSELSTKQEKLQQTPAGSIKREKIQVTLEGSIKLAQSQRGSLRQAKIQESAEGSIKEEKSQRITMGLVKSAEAQKTPGGSIKQKKPQRSIAGSIKPEKSRINSQEDLKQGRFQDVSHVSVKEEKSQRLLAGSITQSQELEESVFPQEQSKQSDEAQEQTKESLMDVGESYGEVDERFEEMQNIHEKSEEKFDEMLQISDESLKVFKKSKSEEVVFELLPSPDDTSGEHSGEVSSSTMAEEHISEESKITKSSKYSKSSKPSKATIYSRPSRKTHTSEKSHLSSKPDDEYWIYEDDFPQFAIEGAPEETLGLDEASSARGSILTEDKSSVQFDRSSGPSISFEEKFSREKLLEAIHEMFAIRQKEERKNFLLNKKVVEYFRRKKSSRALHEDNVEIVYEFINKYRNLLLKLDLLKGQEEALKKESEQKLSELRQEHESLLQETNKSITEFNKLLRDVGITCQSSKTGLLLSEKVVEKYVRKMNLLRDQISLVRLELLKTQDRMTLVLLKTRQLEDLGDGLKVINFEQLRAETQSLSDKIEERNNELSKLRRRCNSDIHILAHVREKQFMLTNTILVQEGVLRDLQSEENSCRNYLNYIKLERDLLRKKLKEMSFDCGLLDKPALLRDYDRTIEKIANAKLAIGKLKEEKEEILEELRAAAVRAESKLVIKSDTQKFDEALNRELANLDKLPYPRIRGNVKPARSFDLSRYRVKWKN